MNRYRRQISLPEVSEEGQRKLSDSTVLLVGAGGLGSPCAFYLAAAGIGNVTIAEADKLQVDNLNRQILYSEADIGQEKSLRARSILEKFNPDIKIKLIGRIDADNIKTVLKNDKYGVVIDATDNFESRYVLNEACVKNSIPLVSGSVEEWSGQISVFDHHLGPCYNCLYPEKSEKNPASKGIIGVIPGIVGTLEAAEAIKLIIGRGDPLIGKVLIVNLLKMEYKTYSISRDPNCKVCRGNR